MRCMRRPEPLSGPAGRMVCKRRRTCQGWPIITRTPVESFVTRSPAMHVRDVRMLLDRLRRGTISTAKAIDRLRHMPYEDLGFAKLDNHRQLRRGFPEVVYGEGKSVPQIVAIMRRMALRGHVVLVTRVTPEVHRKVRARLPGTRYHAEARAMTLNAPKRPSRTPGIL